MKRILFQLIRHRYLCIFVLVLVSNFLLFLYVRSLKGQVDSQVYYEGFEAYGLITYIMGFPTSKILCEPLFNLFHTLIKTSYDDVIAVFIAFVINWIFICLLLKSVDRMIHR